MISERTAEELALLQAKTKKVLDMAGSCINFSQQESCGKCAPCRIGAKRMTEILGRTKNGEGEPLDIDNLVRLGNCMKVSSLCAHGLSTGNTLLTIIGSFRDEFQFQIESHQM